MTAGRQNGRGTKIAVIHVIPEFRTQGDSIGHISCGQHGLNSLSRMKMLDAPKHTPLAALFGLVQALAPAIKQTIIQAA